MVVEEISQWSNSWFEVSVWKLLVVQEKDSRWRVKFSSNFANDFSRNNQTHIDHWYNFLQPKIQPIEKAGKIINYLNQLLINNFIFIIDFIIISHTHTFKHIFSSIINYTFASYNES